MNRHYLALALIVVPLYVAKMLVAQDWSLILPPSREQPHSAKAFVFESGDLTPKESLGFRLFFDSILSSNGKVSCATCHNPDHSYASTGRPLGRDGFPLARRGPSLVNVGNARLLFWDGRASSLEEQVRGPLLNREEMGNKSEQEILDRIKDKYGERFNEQYSGGLSFASLADALASFERTIKSPSVKLERYLDGTGKFTESEARGYELFRGKAGCYECHPVAHHDVEAGEAVHSLTDGRFHNTGLSGDDKGRYNVTKDQADLGTFKTPGLRGCGQSGPYMHDGQLKMLWDVINHYNRGGEIKHVGTKDALIKPLGLTPEEKSDLLEFLKVL